MFQVGPVELLVLVVVGLIVIGPDKLPTLAKDAARLVRALRDMATGAQSQLRNELGDLGPEFRDLGLDDLRNLNPRVALTKLILDDPDERRDNAGAGVNGAGFNGAGVNGAGVNGYGAMPAVPETPAPRPGQQPLGRGEAVPIDDDAT